MTRLVWTGMAVWAFVLPVLAQDAPREDLLGGKYVDRLNGYSIRPPRDGQKNREKDADYLARWVHPDPTTGEILWSLRVHQATTTQPEADIQSCARALAERLERQRGAKIETTKLVELAECPAIRFAGTLPAEEHVDPTGLQTKTPAMPFRQAWLVTGPGEFFVLDFVTVRPDVAWIDATWSAVLQSLRRFDPEAFLLQQKDNTQRAEVLLSALRTDGNALLSAWPGKPQWFLVRKDGLTIGWLCLQGRTTRQNDIDGYEIRTWSMIQLPEQPVRLTRQRMFTDPHFSVGRWRMHVQIGSGDSSVAMVEDGLRQGRLILSTFNDGRRFTQETRTIPDVVTKMYLPKAIGAVLPALLDRTVPAAYTFAEYDRQSNDFQMRTVTVVGPERIEPSGQKREAIKLIDRPSVNADAVELWVSAQGEVLQSRAPDGLRNVSVPAEEVRQAYPRARAVVARMNRAERQAQAAQQITIPRK